MTYRHSRARREFENEISMAMAEFSSIYRTIGSSSGNSRLLGAYYILMYSQIEVYITHIIEDAIHTAFANFNSLDSWPDPMLGYMLHKSENLASDYRKYNSDDDENAVIQKVAKAARKVVSWAASPTTSVRIYPSHFLDKRKYPSPKNLPQLFKRLGMDQIWNILGRHSKTDCKLMLTSLNDIRTGIVHEGKFPPVFSVSDFRQKVSQMKIFVAALDRAISGHFCKSSVKRNVWNSSVC